MDVGTHPSVERIKQAVQSKGGTLSCPLCGREEFALEEVTVLGAGMAEAYGTRRVRRGQLVCENCGCAVVMDLSRLRTGAGGAAAAEQLGG